MKITLGVIGITFGEMKNTFGVLRNTRTLLKVTNKIVIFSLNNLDSNFNLAIFANDIVADYGNEED